MTWFRAEIVFESDLEELHHVLREMTDILREKNRTYGANAVELPDGHPSIPIGTGDGQP